MNWTKLESQDQHVVC